MRACRHPFPSFSHPLSLTQVAALLSALLVLYTVPAEAQVTRPEQPIGWHSVYYIPPFFSPAMREGSAAAEQLAKLCAKNDPRVTNILYEYIETAQRYCRKRDQVYVDVDLFGRLCIVSETHRPNIYFCDPEGDGQVNFNPDGSLALDCDKLKEFVAETFSRAWMDEYFIGLELNWGASLCQKRIATNCSPLPLPLLPIGDRQSTAVVE